MIRQWQYYPIETEEILYGKEVSGPQAEPSPIDVNTHEFRTPASNPCRSGGTMKRRSRLALGTILGTICAVLLATAPGYASDKGRYTEEFHQTYPLAAGGRIELDN